jgi:hypothetical protein
MELKEQLEIVDVQFEDNKKATIIFLDEQMGEIREVIFNKQKYDKQSSKFVDDDERAQQIEEWCKEHFDLSFDNLAQAVGLKKDVYCYDRFNSLVEKPEIKKFEEDMVGQIFEVEIVKAEDDGMKISLQFEYEGELYESKMQYADYLEAQNRFLINPIKRKKQYEKFEEKFGLLVGEIEKMVGKTVLVEVKKAMGKWIYSEIKPTVKKKKKSS